MWVWCLSQEGDAGGAARRWLSHAQREGREETDLKGPTMGSCHRSKMSTSSSLFTGGVRTIRASGSNHQKTLTLGLCRTPRPCSGLSRCLQGRLAPSWGMAWPPVTQGLQVVEDRTCRVVQGEGLSRWPQRRAAWPPAILVGSRDRGVCCPATDGACSSSLLGCCARSPQTSGLCHCENALGGDVYLSGFSGSGVPGAT